MSLSRTIVNYGLAALIMTVYGVRVCPFIESLSWASIFGVIAAGFVIAFPIRIKLIGHISSMIDKELNSAKLFAFSKRILMIDLAIWLSIGIGLSLFNFWFYQFPLESGFKLIVGCLTIGVFSAADLSLMTEYRMMQKLAQSDGDQQTADGIFPLSRKFLILVTIMLVLMSTILGLLLLKDIHYIADLAENSDLTAIYISIAKELIFVISIMATGFILVSNGFARNMNLLFQFQLEAMEAITKGDYKTNVPVVSRDELNVIAAHTNKMIIGLREKERLKGVFGKYMSPHVAQKILESDTGDHLGGRTTEVAILFTDIRSFTTLSESLSPAELVELLNEYFSMIVGCIHKFDGVLDKFIGDAAMGIFGLEGNKEEACTKAVRAAIAVRAQLVGFNRGLSEKGLPEIDNAIGIHFGPVLAGNIGCSERLEYTVIGDHVNIASRLEGQSKDLESPIVISSEVYNRLPKDLQSGLENRGHHNLKGKSEKIEVYCSV